jgi:hypothetical protein
MVWMFRAAFSWITGRPQPNPAAESLPDLCLFSGFGKVAARDPEVLLLTKLLGDTLCIECLSVRLGASEKRVSSGLLAIGKTQTVVVEDGHCTGCLNEAIVYSSRASVLSLALPLPISPRPDVPLRPRAEVTSIDAAKRRGPASRP